MLVYSVFIITAKSIVFNFETTNKRLLKSSWEQEVSLIMNTMSTILALIPLAYYLLNITIVASLYEPQTNIVPFSSSPLKQVSVT